MKKAIEMINYLWENDFYRNDEEKIFKICYIVKNMLEADEEVLSCLIGLYDYKTHELNNDKTESVCFMTNKRFIILNPHQQKNYLIKPKPAYLCLYTIAIIATVIKFNEVLK